MLSYHRLGPRNKNRQASDKVLGKNLLNKLQSEYIYLQLQEYPVDEFTLANTFKAVVGALLKSSGEEKAAHFVRDFVITLLNGMCLKT